MKIEQITRAAKGGVFQCRMDKTLTVVFANDGFYSFIGLSREDFLSRHGNRLVELFSSEDVENILTVIAQQLKTENSFSLDVRMGAPDSAPKWMWLNAEMLRDENGNLYLYCIFGDITARKEEQEQLKAIQQRYQFVLNHTEDIIFEWDYKTKEMYQMGGLDANFSYRPTVHNFPEGLLQGDTNIHPDDVEIFLKNYHSYDNGAQTAYAEYRLHTKSGIYYWCSSNSVGVFENGELVKVMGRIANINGQKMQLLEMSRRAMCDPLTELYNRKATESLVDQYIETTKNMAAMLVIDLDNFKLVNDTLGHLSGDSVLNDIALGIRHIFRDTDIIGRIGGDEFVVFLTDIKSTDAIHRVAGEILSKFQSIFANIQLPQNLSGSVGISVYPQDGASYNELLEKADVALYHAKNTGKNRYILYHKDIVRSEMSVVHSDELHARRTPNDSQRREDLYKLALEKANLTVWIYDIKNARIQRLLCPPAAPMGQFSFENFPQDMIDKGYVHSLSVHPLLDLHQHLKEGKRESCAEVCLLSPHLGEFEWFFITYSAVPDENGLPDIAIGTAKNITVQKKAQLEYKHEMEMRTVLETDILCTSITNLSKNEVEQYRSSEAPDITERVLLKYEDICEYNLCCIPNPDDIKKYSYYTRDMLLQMFSCGKTQLWVDFRHATPDGKLMWVSRSMSMLKDTHVYVYIVVRDTDSKKRQELALLNRVQVDELTGAYEQDAAKELMDNAIHESIKNGTPFALVNFNVDKYAQIMALDDEKCAQAVTRELSRIIGSTFPGQLVGKIFTNQLFVLVQNMTDQNALVTAVNEIRNEIRTSAKFSRYNVGVSVSAGIVFSTRYTIDFASTYRYASIALETARNAGQDKCIVYSNELKAHSPLSAAAPDPSTGTILRCALSLSCVGDESRELPNVLNEIGTYYSASRVCLAEYAQNREYAACCYEWTPVDTTFTTSEQSYDFSNRFPYLYSCLLQSPMVFINNIDLLKFSHPVDYENLKEANIRCIFASAIKSSDAIIGYIFVVDPHKNTSDMDFFATVHKFLSSEVEKRQLREKHEFLSEHDALTGLFNRNKYVEYSKGLKEESLISMGVVSADINGLKTLNNRNGHDIGDRAVKSTADALSFAFEGYDCYRFAGDEFLVVCENISRGAFMDTVAALKGRFDSLDDFTVSVGYSWADVDINLGTLVKYSDEKMMSEKQSYYSKSHSKAKHYDPQQLKALLSDIEKGRYLMFLQPKIGTKSQRVS
ncbi:MAG: diguanylate cyclase, partial [Oscillospiraceae bacterium]